MRADDHPLPSIHTSTSVRRRRRGVLLVAGATTLWGTSGLAGAAADARGLDPLAVSFLRMALGAVVLTTVHGRSGRRDAPRVAVATSHDDRRRLLLVGGGLAGYQAGYFLAVARAGVSTATLVTLGLAPVLVTVADAVRRRRMIRARTVAGSVLAVGGLLALVGLPADQADGVLVGVLFALCSALGYAFVTLAGGPLGDRIGPEAATRRAFVVAAALLAPIALAGVRSWPADDLVLVAVIVYLGVVPTAVAYGWFFSGLRHVPAPVAAILALLEPLVATGLAIPLLGERLDPVAGVGAAALLGAVVLAAGVEGPDR